MTEAELLAEVEKIREKLPTRRRVGNYLRGESAELREAVLYLLEFRTPNGHDCSAEYVAKTALQMVGYDDTFNGG